jgi:hypothetical protein
VAACHHTRRVCLISTGRKMKKRKEKKKVAPEKGKEQKGAKA